VPPGVAPAIESRSSSRATHTRGTPRCRFDDDNGAMNTIGWQQAKIRESPAVNPGTPHARRTRNRPNTIAIHIVNSSRGGRMLRCTTPNSSHCGVLTAVSSIAGRKHAPLEEDAEQIAARDHDTRTAARAWDWRSIASCPSTITPAIYTANGDLRMAQPHIAPAIRHRRSATTSPRG